jgi:two-component system, NtrC family, nitrogen regulation sensor histidine kinase NtrY
MTTVLKRHIFLALGVLAFLLAFVSYLTTEQGPVSATEDKYLSAVQSKVLDEIQQSNSDLSAIKNKIQQAVDGSFSSYQQKAKHPYYVFRNGRLVYWMDHRFVPTIGQLKGEYPIKNIEIDGSRYIVNRLPFVQNNDSITIYSLISLYKKYNTDKSNPYLKSGYNAEIFSVNPLNVSLEKSNEPHNIYSPNKAFLFSVETPRVDTLKNQTVPDNVILLGVLGMFFWGLYVYKWVRYCQRRRQYEFGFGLLAAYLVVGRVIMLYYSIPFTFYESDLFNPSFFAATDLAPSLGDLLLNLLISNILLFYVVNYYFRSKAYFIFLHLPNVAQRIVSVGCVVVGYLTLYWGYRELNSIYINSQFRLDYSLSVDFWYQPLKIACLVVFMLISTAYFLMSQVLANVLLRFNRQRLVGLLLLAMGGVISLCMGLLLEGFMPYLAILNCGYFAILYLMRLPKFLYAFKYYTSLYFFAGALICAGVAAYVEHQQELHKDFELKREFGKKYLAENDEFAEFLLNKAQDKIKTDPMIVTLMGEPFLPRERVQQRIKEKHLEMYLDRYNVEVSVFDARGFPIDSLPGTLNYTAFEQQYRQAKYRTRYPNIYFVNEAGNGVIKEYLSFMPIVRPDSSLKGYLVLTLKLRDAVQVSGVFSELLADTKINGVPDAIDYSQAIFDKGKMLSSRGSYNYERKMGSAILDNPGLFTQGIVAYGYRHVGTQNTNGRQIVVSSPDFPIKRIYSSFSFLFLTLVVYVIVVMLCYAVAYGFSKMNVNFATKIQIYLNIAFLLPLVLVVAITLSIIGNTLKDNQNNSYLSLTKNIAANFTDSFKQYTDKAMSWAYLTDELKKAAKESGRDISLFDTQGHLVTSNQETFYKKGLLSKYVNPVAYVHLVEDKEREKLLNEQLGTLSYTTAYVSMKSYDGQLLGVMSVPFYDSSTSFERQVMEVIGSILNTFTTVFILLLAISYFASNMLTGPLKMLTQKIQKTNLDKLNEPLKWKSDDEIGLLIKEYNKMLQKLQDSKIALANSEKQAAWRDMAKQVAHEIKNPLTPMKLTLQQMQRTLPNEGTPPNKRLIDRAINSLIEQIDNISAIANSFSDFAKMPVPKHELFDLTRVVNSTVLLHANNPSISIRSSVPSRSTWVMGDQKLMGSIITNLILNGVQSVPEERRPEIVVKLDYNDDLVTLEVHDNGSGIAENIRSKVFIPNFSTKKQGNGLGLAMAKHGIEHAGGNIWFESVEDEGTVFFVELPLADEPKVA